MTAQTKSTRSVLHVTASLKGGAARHAIQLGEGLQARGWRVTLAAPRDDRQTAERIASAGVSYHRLGGMGRFPLRAALALRRAALSGGYDLLHVHGHRAAILTRAALMGAPSPPPLVYTVHGYHPPHYPGALSRLYVNTLERLQCGHTAAYISVSGSTEDALLRAVPAAAGKCAVIPNAIVRRNISKEEKRALRTRTREELGIPLEAFTIGVVARLQWQKGIDRLLEAFQWAGRESDFLLIVGDGPQRGALRKKANGLQYGRRCVFAGPASDAYPYYCAMDLFVLPSLWEGMPLTVLEAWDAGVPVIATDVIGSRDVIVDGVNGLLAQNNADGIAAAIHRFHKNPVLEGELIREGLNTLDERHDFSRMVERVEDVYAHGTKTPPV